MKYREYDRLKIIFFSYNYESTNNLRPRSRKKFSLRGCPVAPLKADATGANIRKAIFY